MKKTILITILLCGTLFQAAQAEGVYLGEYGADGPISTGFGLQKLPVVGGVIRATKGMNLRDDRPQIKNQQWSLGKVEGVIYSGEQFVVEEVVVSRSGPIPGDVWARGSVRR